MDKDGETGVCCGREPREGFNHEPQASKRPMPRVAAIKIGEKVFKVDYSDSYSPSTT